MQTNIAVVSALAYIATLHRFDNRAAQFFHMGAVCKAAIVAVCRKLPEQLRKPFLQLKVYILRVKGGKSGSINSCRTAGKAEHFYMARGMPSSAKFFADLPGLNAEIRFKCVQKT